MPAEAHRLHARIRRRDRLVIAVVLLAAVLVLVAAAVASERRAHRLPAGCIAFPEAGVMGGGTRRVCGAEAVRRCTTTRRYAAQCSALKP